MRLAIGAEVHHRLAREERQMRANEIRGRGLAGKHTALVGDDGIGFGAMGLEILRDERFAFFGAFFGLYERGVHEDAREKRLELLAVIDLDHVLARPVEVLERELFRGLFLGECAKAGDADIDERMPCPKKPCRLSHRRKLPSASSLGDLEARLEVVKPTI